MRVLAALTPFVVVVVAILLAVAALVRREMAPKRGHQDPADDDISPKEGNRDRRDVRTGADSAPGPIGEGPESGATPAR